VEKKTFAEEVNAAFREAAAGPMNGVLAVADEPLVSVDFRCTDVSTSIDSSLTMVMGDDMVKVRGKGGKVGRFQGDDGAAARGRRRRRYEPREGLKLRQRGCRLLQSPPSERQPGSPWRSPRGWWLRRVP
jgi:hypothetical protein